MTAPHWEPIDAPNTWDPLVVPGPQGPRGPGYAVVPYSIDRVLGVKVGTIPYPIGPGTWTVDAVAAMVGTGPIGSPVILDVNVNGTSIYPDQSHRPTIAPGTRLAMIGTHSRGPMHAGDYLTVDVDAAGAGAADLTLVVRLLHSD